MPRPRWIHALACAAALEASPALAGDQVSAVATFDYRTTYDDVFTVNAPLDTPFPLEAYADLAITPSFTFPPPAPEDYVMWAFADATGRVRAQAWAHQPYFGPPPPPPGDKTRTFGTSLVWEKTFTRGTSDQDTFTVNLSQLTVDDAARTTDTPPGHPYASLIMMVSLVRIDRPATSPGRLREVLFARVQLTTDYRFGEGCRQETPQGGGNVPVPIDIFLCQVGSDPVAGYRVGDSPLHAHRVSGGPNRVGVDTVPFTGTIDLGDLAIGERYQIRYFLDVMAWSYGSENWSQASLGDPLDAGGGLSLQSSGLPVPDTEPRVQTCEALPDPLRFADHADGTVTDTVTGLMWQRCPLGWTLTTVGPGLDRCSPAASGRVSWQGALQAGAASAAAGFADWRLPNVKELGSLVDLGCVAPAIRTDPFPDAPSAFFWSSTPGRGAAQAMGVSFAAGDVVALSKGSQALARLVRSAADPSLARPALRVGQPLPFPEGDAGPGDLVFQVALDRPATADVTFRYATLDGSALAGSDYQAVTGVGTVPAGALATQVRVPVLGDQLVEPSEAFYLILDQVSAAARLAVPWVQGIILDDEPAVTAWPAEVVEGDSGTSLLAFPITLSRPALADVTVTWSTTDGTATSGQDYLAASGTLTIPAGQTAATVVVTAYGDLTVEPDESLSLVLGTTSANAAPGVAVATGTIRNDDLPGPPVQDAVRYAGDMGGPGNADGVGPAGRLSFPTAIAGDLVADTGNSRVRRLALDGTLTTPFADDLFASGLAVNAAGEALVAESSLNQVRKISGGVVAPFAGSGVAGSADGLGVAASFRSPNGIAVDAAGNAYLTDSQNHTIRKITPGGLVSTLAGTAGVAGSADGQGPAASFRFPTGIAVDQATGTVYVGDGNARLRAITPGGLVTTVAGSTVGSLDAANPLLARFRSLDGLAVDGAGVVFIADGGNGAIRRFDANGVSTLAGALGLPGFQDGPGGAARFKQPIGLAFRGVDLWVVDNNNQALRRVTPAGQVSTMVGAPPLTGSTNGPADVALFFTPKGIATGATPGVVYLADALDGTLRRIDPDPVTGLAATVTAVAGLGSFPGSADGLGAAARFNQPWGVSALGSYVADTRNRTLRRIDAGGNVTTVAGSVGVSALQDGVGTAARFIAPAAVWLAPTGLLYVADTYAVRRYDPGTGVVTTVAGGSSSGFTDGPGGAARFDGVEGLCGDAAGNLYVADPGNSAIRKILPGGEVVTLNKGGPGHLDGPLATAKLLRPTDVACAADGTLFVADGDNFAIRKIGPGGAVSTILGTPGLLGFSPMAAPSVIGKPVRLALDGQALYVTMWQGVLKVTLQ